MLEDVKIIDKRSGQFATWEYFCGNCGASMGKTDGQWPGANIRSTQTKDMPTL